MVDKYLRVSGHICAGDKGANGIYKISEFWDDEGGRLQRTQEKNRRKRGGKATAGS